MDKSGIKHILGNVVLRVAIYLIVCILASNVLSDQLNSIRNEVYGIGNYVNLDFVSNMLTVMNLVFLLIVILFCTFTKKSLYTQASRNDVKLKEYIRFELILELSITLGYVLLSSLLIILIDDNVIKSGLIVPIYIMFRLTENFFVSTVISLLVYSFVIVSIILIPKLIKHKR